jgi:Amt family ammonium transporter
MDESGLVVACVAALAVVLLGLWLVDGRLLPAAPPRSTLGLNLAIAATGAGPWLVLAPLLDPWLGLIGPLYLPVALLGSIAAFLATVVPRTMGAGAARAVVFALGWSTLVFVPAAAISFGTMSALDHGGSLAANVAPGASALSVLLVGGGRAPRLQPMTLTMGVAGVVAVVFGWVAWLVGSELAVDQATLGIVLAGLLGSLGGLGGWLLVQRVAHQATSLNAVAAGAISGVVAITAGAPLYTPLSAAVTGLVAGGAAGLLTMSRAKASRRAQWSIAGTHLLAGGIGVVVIGVAGSGVGFIFTGQPALALSQLVAVLLVAGGSLLVSMLLWLAVRRARPPARLGQEVGAQ